MLKASSYICGWLFAFIGLVLAVYSIKTITDRPANIKDVLLLAADVLEEPPHHKRLITLICEYPAWGTLSERKTAAYKRYVRSWETALHADNETRVVVIAPARDAQVEHIGSYANAYGMTVELVPANKENQRLLNIVLADSNRSKHWLVAPPRYQAIIISDLEEDDKPVHRKAVFWLAARSSEDVTTKPIVPGERRKHVPILGWQISDPDEIEDLFESAIFFAEQSTENATKKSKFTIKQYMGIDAI